MFLNKYTKKLTTISIIMFIILLTVAGCSTNENNNSSNSGFITGRVEIENNDTSEENIEIYATSGLDSPAKPRINKPPIHTAESRPSEYIVKFTEEITKNYLQTDILPATGKVIKKISSDTFLIKIPDEKLKLLQQHSLTDSIEPNYLVHIQNIPDDPLYSKQWNLHMLNYEQYRGQLDDLEEITVAVLDTGIISSHPDLKDNIIEGYDFIDDNNNPEDPSKASHGTHVAGIMGTITDNEVGIAGGAENVKIMPVRIIDDNGSGDYGNLISGLNWAVENGADIINLSLAGSIDSPLLKETVQEIYKKGVTIIAAAGNSGQNHIYYPAKYEEVISVGAVGPDGNKAYYSNYGTNLDLVAPGGDALATKYSFPKNQILSTVGSEEKYEWKQGTSMAAPHVSSAAALLAGSGINNPKEIKQTLIETATPAGNGTGAGILNIPAALGLSSSDSYVDNETDNNKKINFENVKIFATGPDPSIVSSKDIIKSSTDFITPDENGNFTIETEPGLWTITAWLDKDGNGQISDEDFLAPPKEIKVTSDEIHNITLKLKSY